MCTSVEFGECVVDEWSSLWTISRVFWKARVERDELVATLDRTRKRLLLETYWRDFVENSNSQATIELYDPELETCALERLFEEAFIHTNVSMHARLRVGSFSRNMESTSPTFPTDREIERLI